jgi:hypothetical protein
VAVTEALTVARSDQLARAVADPAARTVDVHPEPRRVDRELVTRLDLAITATLRDALCVGGP